ncbi:A disintegrin and metalloproteinase with thrombospondin motifs 4 [Elysia marginata]|uniref:A disintegrin and metalloproteinase with thrombospondin motifs 4 n=1 Tax=Elysia marginata TaxID=1093978 RepID=A0AAV4FMW2_9GAST|nr:A disintegrin and metalloproteinase with thrombospondin motifs 4 [Elysia marginata]
MCHPNAYQTSVVTFGGQATGVTQAHEIAHIFGALHNGKEGHHVMRSARSFEYLERFTFTECSAHDIKQYLDRNGDHCLLQTKSSSRVPNVPVEKYSGRLFNADTLCRQIYGPESFACNLKKGADLRRTPDEDPDCLYIGCQDPNTKDRLHCFDIQTPEGMPCDHNKVCKRGKCVSNMYSKFAQACKSGCMLGDQHVVFVNGGKTSCEGAFKIYGLDMCSNWNPIKYQCCEFCYNKAKATGICMGDYPTVNVDQRSYSCQTAVDMFGINKMCKDSYGNSRCCQTCELARISDDCYGDELYVNVGNKGVSCAEGLRLAGDNLCTSKYGRKRCCSTCIHRPGVGKRSVDHIPMEKGEVETATVTPLTVEAP